jgi:hypothetical protein
MRKEKFVLLIVVLVLLVQLSGCVKQNTGLDAVDIVIPEIEQPNSDELDDNQDEDEKQSIDEEASIDSDTEDISNVDTSNWSLYRNEYYEFKFPSNIIQISEATDRVILSHKVPFHHQDVCDMRDNPAQKEYIEDFKVRITLYANNLEDSLRQEKDNHILDYYFKNGSLELSNSFISKVDTTYLSGYMIESGAEGCGIFKYYFPISQKLTMVIERDYGDLRSISLLVDELKNQPGIILPESETEVFYDILNSIKFKF